MLTKWQECLYEIRQNNNINDYNCKRLESKKKCKFTPWSPLRFVSFLSAGFGRNSECLHERYEIYTSNVFQSVSF